MTARLCATAVQYERRFDGEMAMKGIDPWEMPFDRFCNVVYVWLLGERDDNEIAKFDARLWLPPKGKAIPKESPWSAENESKSFASFSAAVNPDKKKALGEGNKVSGGGVSD